MNTRTNIVIDDDLIAQAMTRAGVTTKKAAVEAALKAYVRKPDYAGLLALRGSGVLDPDYDPSGPYGLTPEALARRGWNTFEEARIGIDKQRDDLLSQPVVAAGKAVKATRQSRAKKSQVVQA
ncbi:MAG: hypothetical protein CVU24_14335 [Betaproteobacteria bacterium HGW-Betaproteobacteria-18]|nr:MAG: hypothetical protein CVU24_14335 [Betaproteobacteria bacterium HGW-Betaproteobacteria-18]